jgi:hypothetical protein
VTSSASAGALGPDLSDAIAEHTEALARLEVARAELAQAQRAVSETTARLTAIAAGARITRSRALVAVEGGAEDPPAGAR